MSNFESLNGKEIKGWKLSDVLGKGADGIVYGCQKETLKAAIKLYFPEELKINGISEAQERLELQLGLVGSKYHPNLVEIYEGGKVDELETLYLVMEFVQGTSLDKLVGRVPASKITNLMKQLVSAAKELENLDLVHRDIKPANIVVSEDFEHLTLLDLGIIFQIQDEIQDRISGDEFVATVRYSPPEFIWRKESSDKDAWRAITFYQIGATLHDMIMGFPIFTDYDKPRATLYDSIKAITPEIKSTEVDGWLIQLTRACLLKDWRQRLQFVNWESFSEPVSVADIHIQEKRIRLHQIRKEESRRAVEKLAILLPKVNREQELWSLNNTLILEIRKYLNNSQIFSKFIVEEHFNANRAHLTDFKFDKDSSKGFESNIIISINLVVDPMLCEATKMTVSATLDGKVVHQSSWTEMFTVESAFEVCQRSLLNIVDSVLLI